MVSVHAGGREEGSATSGTHDARGVDLARRRVARGHGATGSGGVGAEDVLHAAVLRGGGARGVGDVHARLPRAGAQVECLVGLREHDLHGGDERGA